MSSELQIEANRRNAQKSTGPRTPTGKAVSSLNHTQSGLYAESQIIIGERQCDFEDLAAALAAPPTSTPRSTPEAVLCGAGFHPAAGFQPAS
jgi:hypothetical protein